MVKGGYRPPFLINLWNFPDISLFLHQGQSGDRIALAACTAIQSPDNAIMRAARETAAFSLEQCARLCGGDWAIIMRPFQVSDVALCPYACQRMPRTHVLIRDVQCDERPNGCPSESTKCQIRQGVGVGPA